MFHGKKSLEEERRKKNIRNFTKPCYGGGAISIISIWCSKLPVKIIEAL